MRGLPKRPNRREACGLLAARSACAIAGSIAIATLVISLNRNISARSRSYRSATNQPTGRCFDELAGDANAVARFPNAAFKHIPHTQLAADLLDVD